MSECDETLEDLIQPSLLFPPFSYKKLSDLRQVTPLTATEMSLESGPTCPALSLDRFFLLPSLEKSMHLQLPASHASAQSD